MYEQIWELSPRVNESGAYSELQQLTRQLTDIYDKEGRLHDNPFASVHNRKLSLPKRELNNMLKSSICLVTGGSGCVGGSLVNRLLCFDVRKIVVVDKQSCDNAVGADKRISYVQADIRDREQIRAVFETFRPDYVFHTAAQRNPGYAETHVLDTISTNILGTLNVLNACELNRSVKQCVFSSTGKASRYYTDEVYAATKKICEYLFDYFATQGSSTHYSMVRFTHILENSLMNIELSNAKNVNHLAVHSPGKYVAAQNVNEASGLMLNALLESKPGSSKFLSVRHLEWPVESLEVALYYIKEAGGLIPVIFKGNPPGYMEKLFRGQLDWSDPQEINILINVYECRNKKFNAAGDIIISHIVPVDHLILQKELRNILDSADEKEAKTRLSAGLKNMVLSSLGNVNKHDTVRILQWGFQMYSSIYGEADGEIIEPSVPILIQSLKESDFATKFENIVS